MSLPERSAALLMEFIFHIETKLAEKGIPADDATEIAKDTCDMLRKNFGGEQFYFPKGHDLDVMLRHHQIFKRFNGTNQNELSKEFGISETHVYRILKAAYEKELDERQPQLFK
jgi:Mor family transcriptional regulator